MVQVCLGSLTQRFNPLRTTILAKETPPSFFNLQSMLLVEENHVKTKITTSEGQMLFSNSDGGRRRGRGGRGQFDLFREGNSNLRQEDGSHQGTFGRRGSFHAEQGQQNRPSRRPGAPKKKKRVGFNKSATHKLHREREIRRLRRTLDDETHPQKRHTSASTLRPEQYG